MSDVQKCKICGLMKSVTEFHSHWFNKSGLDHRCKSCMSIYNHKKTLSAREMMIQIKLDAGGCENPDCHSSEDHTRLLSHEENLGLFDHDHIDERLKLHPKETHPQWIAINWQDFINRVKPNLQVLCTHCHRERSKESMRLGNSIHSKKYGRKPPAQFVDPGHTLFNPPCTVLLFEDEDIEVLPNQIKREDDWFVTRDGHGYLLSYRDALEGETFGYLYDADGEEIT